LTIVLRTTRIIVDLATAVERDPTQTEGTVRRIVLLAILAFHAALAASFAHADPVTYYVTLHETLGNTGSGTGSFTIPYAPTAYKVIYSPLLGNLTNMSFMIGGDSFDLGNSPYGSASALFINQALVGFGYSGGTLDDSIDLTLGPTYYEFQDLPKGLSSQGYMTTSTDPPSASTPEPASIVLLLTGTGAIGVLIRRRTASSVAG
jgi:hypothetical protein